MNDEPRVVAFLCNWCSYAGADLAGTSRTRYPANIRPIRVMCSGRVDPSYVLEALKRGADGVLVSGCHIGDCHYISGNEKAEKKMALTSRLLELLGVGSERLRLEWISASEGEKFAEVTTSFTNALKRMDPSPFRTQAEATAALDSQKLISDAISETNVRYCLECGKCSSSCPVARINDEYSPRRVIERIQLGMEDKILTSKELWMCMACYLCRERCPSDVRYPEFVARIRSAADPKIMQGLCAHGAVPLTISTMMANPSLKQNRMGWVPEDVKISEEGDILYFAGCLPYFDIIFDEIKPRSVAIAQNALRVLNRLGITPTVMKNERCCGHDLLWTGDSMNFRKLAEMNVEDMRASGAKKVVTTCAECYRTIGQDYQDVVGDLGFEVVHFSQFLADLVERDELKFGNPLDKRVVYHDPCRLGRHMGVYDAPRKVLESIPGLKLMEMERNREEAMCCGTSSWLACSRYSKVMQAERLREAKATGADLLATTCPKCQIHWKCVMSESPKVKPKGIDMEISDLSILAAHGMGLVQMEVTG